MDLCGFGLIAVWPDYKYAYMLHINTSLVFIIELIQVQALKVKNVLY